MSNPPPVDIDFLLNSVVAGYVVELVNSSISPADDSFGHGYIVVQQATSVSQLLVSASLGTLLFDVRSLCCYSDDGVRLYPYLLL